jgi:ABC-type phosphate transport system substrate-binding protein
MSVKIPNLPLNRRDRFRLTFLLDGEVPPGVKDEDRVKRTGGHLRGGGTFPRQSRSGHRRNTVLAVSAVLALIAGVIGGVWIANRALVPRARCASGTLTISGSTAFSPVATIAKSAYVQQCPNGNIAIDPIGSAAGLTALTRASNPSGQVAMVDGAPSRDPGSGFTRTPAGVVIFAVVANHSLAGQLSEDQIRGLFTTTGSAGGNYVLVGREPGSGTRDTFDSTVLGKPESALDNVPTCPPPGSGTAVSACTVKTTMELLAYVNATPNAIGYAEAVALPNFPDIDIVPLNGKMPTREGALRGGYPFVATENLYFGSAPSDLTTDFISFLKSDAMAPSLQGEGYVSCSEIGGTDLSGQCV